MELARAVALVGQRLPLQEADHTREFVFLADGQLQRHGRHAKGLLAVLERTLRERALAIHLVEHDDARDPEGLGLLPDRFGLHLDTIGCRHDDECGVGAPHRAERVVDEVAVAGRVDDVDLLLLVRHPGERSGDRAPSALLLGLEVERAGAGNRVAQPRSRSRIEEHGFAQRRLATGAVSDQGNVSDVGGIEEGLGHASASQARSVCRRRWTATTRRDGRVASKRLRVGATRTTADGFWISRTDAIAYAGRTLPSMP